MKTHYNIHHLIYLLILYLNWIMIVFNLCNKCDVSLSIRTYSQIRPWKTILLVFFKVIIKRCDFVSFYTYLSVALNNL